MSYNICSQQYMIIVFLLWIVFSFRRKKYINRLDSIYVHATESKKNVDSEYDAESQLERVPIQYYIPCECIHIQYTIELLFTILKRFRLVARIDPRSYRHRDALSYQSPNTERIASMKKRIRATQSAGTPAIAQTHSIECVQCAFIVHVHIVGGIVYTSPAIAVALHTMMSTCVFMCWLHVRTLLARSW